MSLINQMLNDLDKRSPGTRSPNGRILSGVRPTPRRRVMHPGLVRVGLLLVLLAGIGVVMWQWTFPWPAVRQMAKHAVMLSAPATSEATAAVRPVPPQPFKHTPPPPDRLPVKIEPSPPVAVKPIPAALEKLHIVQIGDQLRVAAAFSRMPAYRLIRQARGSQLVLELPSGTIIDSLSDYETPPLLKEITHETIGDHIQLVFSFGQACRYDEFRLRNNTDEERPTILFMVRPEPSAFPAAALGEPLPAKPSAGAPEGLADAAQAPAPVPPSADRHFVRQAVRATPHKSSESLFRKGVAAFRTGRLHDAEQALQAALAIEPSHIGARDVLLHLLDRQDRRSQIKALLAEGVQEVPDHLPYRIRLARLLINAGDLSQARIELMRSALPPASEAPDLHAMLATVNLRQGRYREAADTYRSLLAFKPEQAVWWMGLGIALEGDATLDQAREAYGEALLHEGLSDDLQKFIHQRLATSVKVQGRQPSNHRNPDEDRS